MLEKIREGSQGVVAKGILVLVIFSFAFAGVSSYLGTSTDLPVAIVNGDEVSTSELEQAFQNERSRIEQQLGDMFETLAADENYMAGIKQSVLDKLVGDKLIDQAAFALGLRVSDEQIKQAIVSEPAFQTDGVFDNNRYQAVLRQLGYQAVSFKNMMRVDMTRRQLLSALVGSEFALEGEAKQLAEVQGQTRDIRFLTIDSNEFLTENTVTDEEAQTYYDQHQAQYLSPEKVSLEYLELNVADLAKEVTTSPEEVKTYYDEHKKQYQTAEKRLAAHILVNKTEDAAADEAKAAAIVAKLAAGESFEALAKTDSDDKFSGEQGGKLDWFEPGVMDADFDKALFSLEKGAYSDVVSTEFGYHIVKLLDVQAGQLAAFADVEAKIVAQLQEKKALDKFYGLQTKLADISYEIPDTLADAATAIGASIKTTELFDRNAVPAQFNQTEFIKAAFSDQVIASGMNSDVIEIAPNHILVVRMKEHQTAGTLSFSTVKASILARLQQDKAQEAALAKAAEYMAQLKDSAFDASSLSLTTQAKLSRYSQDVDSGIVAKAFQMPVPAVGAVSIDTAELASGYAIVLLDKVNQAEGINDNVLDAMKQRLTPQYSEADYRGLIASLKAKADIEYPAPE
ncbi:SurA N-terminal domain-containing protein [Shewanella sp. SR44-3]|uniref:SurA N-terminal domain-containing protein n=1 Tax=Shewanella sp. SR44-3 TaxID=2760936 RepID=UPI0015F78E22|nr:SurA N-terminal domain-containing protein [Shewanella sp. SR44-3]MBB1270982.1 SurA N-terminal domain-containing protein [Shewanella sp. SR44-3]